MWSLRYQVLLYASVLIQLVASIPCKWDMTITEVQARKQHCGYTCPDYWAQKDPYYCSVPIHACCCAPVCNITQAKEDAFLGVNWSDQYMKQKLSRTHQFQILKDSGINHIKMFSPSGLEDLLRVFGPDGTRVYVGIPNRELTRLASNPNYATEYVRKFLLPYNSLIAVVIVGNEPFICIKTAEWASRRECGALNAPTKLLPAIKNVQKALQLEGMKQPVSTALNGGIMELQPVTVHLHVAPQSKNPWTPCVADFKIFLMPLLQPLFEFLRENKAPFIVNIYSWFAAMAGHISPKSAAGFPVDRLSADGKYNYYFNYDMQVDMLRIAMCKNNVTDLTVWIGETGWPSDEHPKANLRNAEVFAENVIRRSKGLHLNDPTKDLIRFRKFPTTVFLFEAFDEEKKYEIEHGNRFENSFGLFYEDGDPKWRDQNRMIIFNITGKNDKVEIPPRSASE